MHRPPAASICTPLRGCAPAFKSCDHSSPRSQGASSWCHHRTRAPCAGSCTLGLLDAHKLSDRPILDLRVPTCNLLRHTSHVCIFKRRLLQYLLMRHVTHLPPVSRAEPRPASPSPTPGRPLRRCRLCHRHHFGPRRPRPPLLSYPSSPHPALAPCAFHRSTCKQRALI